MSYAWHDVVGNLGVMLIVSCYLLLQIGKLQSTDLSYSVVNGIGAVLIMASLTYQFNVSAFLIEAFWFVISALGVYLWFRRWRQRSPRE